MVEVQREKLLILTEIQRRQLCECSGEGFQSRAVAQIQRGKCTAVHVELGKCGAAAEIQRCQFPAICHDKVGQVRLIPQNDTVHTRGGLGGGHRGRHPNLFQKIVGGEIQDAVQLLHAGSGQVLEIGKDLNSLQRGGVVDAGLILGEIDRLHAENLVLAQAAVPVRVKAVADILTEGGIRKDGFADRRTAALGAGTGKRSHKYSGKQQQQDKRKFD